jgi:hypothetical protein
MGKFPNIHPIYFTDFFLFKCILNEKVTKVVIYTKQAGNVNENKIGKRESKLTTLVY